MYNIYTALVLIYIMYIYSVTYTSEAIAGGRRKMTRPIFFPRTGGWGGGHTSVETYTCKERKKDGRRRNNSSANDLCIPRDNIAKKNM